MKNKKTLDYYGEIVEQYVNQNGKNETVKKQRNLFSSILKGTSILDVGSGMGRDTEAFREEGLEVLGIDGSLPMLNKSKELYPQSCFLRFNLLEDDYSELGSYDGIWCCASLLHFTPGEMDLVFRKLLLHLKEGGVFYFSLKTDIQMRELTDGGRWFQIYTKEYLDKFIRRQNMKTIHYQENISPSLQTFSSYFLKRNI